MKLKVSKTEADVRYILYTYTHSTPFQFVAACISVQTGFLDFDLFYELFYGFFTKGNLNTFVFNPTHTNTYKQVKRANQDSYLLCYSDWFVYLEWKRKFAAMMIK